MRNMMICVSVMLAVFLGWPLAFGEHGTATLETSRAEAAAPAAKAELVPASATVATAPAVKPTVPESCYKRYQREVKQCTGNNGAACRLKSADNWDLCEATGFWPE